MPKPGEPHAAFRAYLAELQRNLASGIAKENTHRPALKDLIEALDPTVMAFNDPKHIDVGAPDFTIRRKGQELFPVGWIETKDIGEDLSKVAKSEQLQRYFGLASLILTDYLEFRWYTDGKLRLSARLATVGPRNKLVRDAKGEQSVTELLTAFLRHSFQEVTSPRDLATRMADLAHIIRDITLKSYNAEAENGSLHRQLQAFRETLIPDLSPEQFADMYAQTIAYGLFAACAQNPGQRNKFARENAAHLIPKTNPFLRKLFNEIAGPDLDERIQPWVDDLVRLLRAADIGSIMADFGKRTAKEDPVVHFYEDFLKEYDPKVREMRGVYYTPEPVVSYIVRSVDHLLKTRFNKPLGLADKDVLILDPACGTGTFLYYVIRHIYCTLVQHGQKGQWNAYVSENLLKRIFGFELLMAPYAVAHLKLGLLLQELGYQFDTDERLGIFLTNTLEEAAKKSELLFAQYIADEANAASAIKRDLPIMVVLGNPPYSGISANRGEWITQLLRDYREINGIPLREKKVWLADDYVKFVRFGQWRIQKTGHGILAFITNHGYVDNPTFRAMRHSLKQTFSESWVMNLHGNSKKKERSPDGSEDKNVFDIQQGVAIGVFLREHEGTLPGTVNLLDLWGSRKTKNEYLATKDVSTSAWTRTEPASPNYLFVADDKKPPRHEYQTWLPLHVVMPENITGIITARDSFTLGFDAAEVVSRISSFIHDPSSDQEIKARFKLAENYAWRVSEARATLREATRGTDLHDFVKLILYRPFDFRKIFFHPAVVWRPRETVMRHLCNDWNVALLATRQTKDRWDVFATRALVGHKSLSAYDITSAFPLFASPRKKQEEGLFASNDPAPNYASTFLHEVEAKTGLRFRVSGHGDLKTTFDSFQLLAYCYSIFYSPTFRSYYGHLLKADFPRIPVVEDQDLFRSLTQKGEELIAWHLLERKPIGKHATRYDQDGDHLVEKVQYSRPSSDGKIPGRVFINRTQYFEGVPPEIWNFHIGGYQVCEKWLKDRKGRTLSSDDIDHYQKIIVAISETIRLMREIDALIPGWPLP